nr:hypothetical protein HmN_000800500 [Hymenolepis microstoma]
MDSRMFTPSMPAVIDKYAAMDIDDSEGEELDYYIDNCPLINDSKSSQSVQNCLMDSLTPKFFFDKNVDPPNEQRKHSNHLVKRKRSPSSPNFDSRRARRAPDHDYDIQIRHKRNIISKNSNENFPNLPQHRGNQSLSPCRVIPFEVFERNYQAHVRRHSVSPSRKKFNVENGQKKCNLVTVAPFELLKTNYQRMERCLSLPSFSDSGRLTESATETEKIPVIASRQTSDLSRTVPNWFTPPRASTVRLSRSVLARHSLSSGTLLDNTYSPDSRLLSWVRSQLPP